MSDATPTRIVDSLQFTISIHAPHERCDFVAVYVLSPLGLFQSTHRMSDATTVRCRIFPKNLFQSTHRMSDATIYHGY